MADDAFYASMPPLGTKKALFAVAARRFGEWRLGEANQCWKLMFIDVKKAHLETNCDADDV